MCRESVKRKLREAERKYVQNEICNSNKSKSLWKIIRVASREKRQRNQITQEMLPNIIYQHWARQRLLADIPEFDQFCLYPVTCYEIQKIAMLFSSKKALGLDKLSLKSPFLTFFLY